MRARRISRKGYGEPVLTKSGKDASEPDDDPRLCSQFALDLFKEKKVKPGVYPECKRDHHVTLVSLAGGKDVALAYIKMRSATPA